MTADLVCQANFSNRSMKQIYCDFLKNDFLTKKFFILSQASHIAQRKKQNILNENSFLQL